MKKETNKTSSWKLGLMRILTTVLFLVSGCGDGSNSSRNKAVQSPKEVYMVVEELPEYPGGVEELFKYVTSEIKYPKEAIVKEVEGQVSVQFVIERDGSISDVQLVKGIGGGCDEAVIRALQSAPSFRPGSQRGRTVRVQRVMPIIFQLTSESNSTEGVVIVKEINNLDFNLKVDANYANGKWTGTIYDENSGNVLPGANIVVVGTTRGTVSDLDGTFSINTMDSNDLMISFVGYKNLRLDRK